MAGYSYPSKAKTFGKKATKPAAKKSSKPSKRK